MRQIRMRTIFAVLLLLLTAGGVLRAEEVKFLPELTSAEYQNKLLEIASLLERGDAKGAVGADVWRLAVPMATPEMTLPRLCQIRSWDKKVVLYTGLAAYKVIVPAVHYAYVLVITDRGPALWEFRIFKNPAKAYEANLRPQGWYVYAVSVSDDLSALGGRMQLLLDKGMPLSAVDGGK